MVESPAVTYQVDASDRLCAFDDGWTTFAESNNGLGLLPALIRGRALWDFISDPATAQLYKSMMARLRAGGASIHFQFRCDSPDRRRLLRMEMSRGASGGIVFAVTSVREETRAPVALLDPTRATSDELVTVCAWCKRTRLPAGAWVEVEEAVRVMELFLAEDLPRLTHGICESCSAAMMSLADPLADRPASEVSLGPLSED